MSRAERVLVGLNVCLLGIAGWVLLRPGGPLRESFERWRQHRAIEVALAREWNGMIASGGRLDSGGAHVSIVEFSDYQCPFCRLAHAVVDSLVADPAIGIVYRHFPLRIHSAAAGAARASVCAEVQGRFRDMDRRLFETTAWQADTNWAREAVAIGVPDIRAFESCLQSPLTIARLSADSALAARLGVKGTPTFFVAHETYSGIRSAGEMRGWIQGGK